MDDATVPWWRTPVLLAGLAALAWGLWLLVSGGPATSPVSAATWLAGGLVAHDAAFAPVTVAAGWVLLRLTTRLPAGIRYVAAIAAVVAVCLAAVALPALLAPGIDNPSATPRDYGRGLVTLLAADAVIAALATGLTIARARRTAARRRPTDRRPASR